MEFLPAVVYNAKPGILNAHVENHLVSIIQNAFLEYGGKHELNCQREGSYVRVYSEHPHPYQEGETPSGLSHPQLVASLRDQDEPGTMHNVGYRSLVIPGWNVLNTSVQHSIRDTLNDAGFSLFLTPDEPN